MSHSKATVIADRSSESGTLCDTAALLAREWYYVTHDFPSMTTVLNAVTLTSSHAVMADAVNAGAVRPVERHSAVTPVESSSAGTAVERWSAVIDR